MNTTLKVLMVAMLLLILSVIVLNITRGPVNDASSSIIGNLFGASDQTQRELCQQRCDSGEPLPPECKELEGFSCN